MPYIEPDPTPTPEPAPTPAPYYPSTPSNPQSTPTPAPSPSGGKIDGGQGSGSTKIDVVTKDETATIPEISATTISNVAKNTDGNLINIDVSGTGDGKKKVSRVTLPKKTIKKVITVLESPENDKDRLIITFDTASISSDVKALSSIVKQAKGEYIQFVVEEISDTGLNNSQQSILDTFKKSAGKNVEQIFSEYVLVYDEAMLNGPGNEVHRLLDTESRDHLFTISKAERDAAEKSGWKYEGVAFIAIEEGKEVYRLRNSQTGRHVYTASEKERDALVAMGWDSEGSAFLSYGESNVYRLANPGGMHMFTTNAKERDALVKAGWIYEGVGFKAN